MYFNSQPPIEYVSIFLTILLGLQPESVRLLSSQAKVFSDNSTLKLNKLAISKSSIFVGAVNRLYQLSFDLELLANITTGPFSTNSSVTKPGYNEKVIPKSMDNHNKILLIYEDGLNSQRLIACGTLQNCSIYFLDETIISESNVINVFEPVVANTHTASTIAFIRNFLCLVDDRYESRKILWIAQSYSNFTEPFEVPALAVRNFPYFKLSDNCSKILVNGEYRDKYAVNYIYGFQSLGNVYYSNILTTQQSSATETSPYISKLIRICSNGDGNELINRYAEIPIECIVEGERPYNLVQAAYVLIQPFSYDKHVYRETLLFAIFSQSETMNSQKPNNRSALCIYSLKHIDKIYKENMMNCFDGKGNAGLEFISPVRQCIKHSIDEDSCPSGINFPFGGNIPIKVFSVLTFDAHLTAIATRRLPENSHIDVFVGTSTGHLKKIIVENSTSSCEYDDVTVDERSSVNANLLFSPSMDDDDDDDLLVMTEHKLTKVNLEKVQINCIMFSSYDACVQSNTTCNYWCSHTNECTTTKCGCNIRIGYWKLMYNSIKSENLSIIQPHDSEYLQHDISTHVKLRSSSDKFSKILLQIKEFLHCQIADENFNITSIAKVAVESGSAYTVNCTFPNSSLAVPSGSHNFSLTLSIIITDKNIPFVWSTNISFHDCNTHTSCLVCTESMSPCYWRTDEQKCIFKHGIKKHKKTGIVSNTLANSCLHPAIPAISSFWPTKAVFEGSTFITIRGENLGYSLKDIMNPITVSGVPCIPIEDQFEPMKKVVCFINQTSPQKVEKGPLFETNQAVREGPVEMMINYVLVKSREIFTFAVPKIHSVYPHLGSVSGGTNLIIEGEYLDVGRLISVHIGEIPCIIFSLDTAKIECITSPCYTCNELSQEVVSVTFGHVFYKDKYAFGYINNYNHGIDGFNKKPKSIPAGGIATKTGFQDSAYTGKKYFIQCEKSSFNGSCEIPSKSADIVCKSPYIPDIKSDSINSEYPMSLNCTVIWIDSSDLYKSIVIGNVLLSLYPNPEFHNFSTKFEEFTGTVFIIIKGNDIDKSCQIMDIHVKAGNHSCSIISLSLNETICILRRLNSTSLTFKDDLDQAREELDKIEFITVSIGEHFEEIVLKANTSANNSSVSIIIYIVVTASVFILIIIIVGKVYLKNSQTMKQMQRRMNKMGMDAISMRHGIKQVIIENKIQLDGHLADVLNLPNVTIEVNASYESPTTEMATAVEYLLPLDEKWEFPRGYLTLGKHLGEGEFGTVVQGEAIGILEENVITTVAVKMLKDSHSDSDMIDLVKEMEVLKLIGAHENVLRVLGCCTQNGPLLIITEFAQYGNLLHFLRKRHYFIYKNTSEMLAEHTLLTFALQVARGMEYLASKKCVHRDLAARNILVSHVFVLKIADFGLARNIQSKEYYKKKTKGRLPVKWMAPEALTHLLFTIKSDVWSYGILLWEILTLGGVPYPAFTDMGKLIKDLKSGYRLEQPSNCSSKTYNLMRECWHYLPEERPNFSSIAQELCEMLPSEVLDQHASENFWSNSNESNSSNTKSESNFSSTESEYNSSYTESESSSSDNENEVDNLLP
ncbi:hepatocyte growth factor receptor-like isoform X1 [Planococcus citri]|uniref:hepatocyte growth factor receptor-like isoform X1 n=2 Tax=Planococcus citri TaxID=170843 RepID=UPI0031FA20B3